MSKLAYAIAVLCFSLSWAHAENANWVTSRQGCKVWSSTPQPNETVSWTGPCRNKLAHGKGTLIWFLDGRPSETYEGQLQGGHYEGQGLQTWPTGARYEGAYRKDRAHGRGVYRTETGETFAGNWVNGCLRDGGRVAAVGVLTSECR